MTRSKDKKAKKATTTTDAKIGETEKPLDFKNIKGRTPEQEDYLEKINVNDIVICQGVAGTGKTYLAVATALRYLFSKRVNKITITRPVISTGASMGHLPGSFEDKLHPYLLPILDALNEMIGQPAATKLREAGIIEIAPLAYMRGRTFKSTFMVLDEAQNATVEEILMYMTRIGNDSKMVITGDCMQADIKHSGLNKATIALSGVEGIATVGLSTSSIQRHKLVAVIIEKLAPLLAHQQTNQH